MRCQRSVPPAACGPYHIANYQSPAQGRASDAHVSLSLQPQDSLRLTAFFTSTAALRSMRVYSLASIAMLQGGASSLGPTLTACNTFMPVYLASLPQSEGGADHQVACSIQRILYDPVCGFSQGVSQSWP